MVVVIAVREVFGHFFIVLSSHVIRKMRVLTVRQPIVGRIVGKYILGFFKTLILFKSNNLSINRNQNAIIVID